MHAGSSFTQGLDPFLLTKKKILVIYTEPHPHTHYHHKKMPDSLGNTNTIPSFVPRKFIPAASKRYTFFFLLTSLIPSGVFSTVVFVVQNHILP